MQKARKKLFAILVAILGTVLSALVLVLTAIDLGC